MTDANTGLDATQGNETTTSDVDVEPNSDAAEATTDGNADVFPREYVEKLRTESKGHRDRATTAETRAAELETQLHTALVTATGRLHDATDLPFNAEHLTSPEALSGAITALLESKPHLKARNVSGDVGQGRRGDSPEPFSLLGTLKNLV